VCDPRLSDCHRRPHGRGDNGFAEVIGRHLDIPVASIPPEDSVAHFGWIGTIWAIDAPASNSLTRERLAWRPTGPGLIEDLDSDHYFETP
jgi:hypothetical protein